MRLLHTADLHLGRAFCGLALDDDQQAVLDQILDALIETRAEALLIAGDIFDRAAPPVGAVRQFNDFLQQVIARTGAAVALIAGNHDSGDRIGAWAVTADPARVLIRGPVAAREPALILRDRHGPVAISALPFAPEHAARAALGDEGLDTPQAILAAQVDRARREVPDGARWVILAHATVTGGVAGEAERPLTRIGGVEEVSPRTFAGAAYVALGHLHRPQTVAPGLRYAGAPLAFGFDEAGHDKSMTLVDLDGAGAVTLTELPFRPRREVRVMTGRHAELLAAPPWPGFLRAVLTDPAPVIDAMRRLRDVHPYACDLAYLRDLRDLRAPEVKAWSAAPADSTSPADLTLAFVAAVTGQPPDPATRDIIAAALSALAEGDPP
jgi:exonuclease SbcD